MERYAIGTSEIGWESSSLPPSRIPPDQDSEVPDELTVLPKFL